MTQRTIIFSSEGAHKKLFKKRRITRFLRARMIRILWGRNEQPRLNIRRGAFIGLCIKLKFNPVTIKSLCAEVITGSIEI